MELLKEDQEVVKSVSEKSLKEELEKGRQKRAKECGAELQAVMEKYNCTVMGVPGFTAQGTVACQIVIQAKD